jgi:hypothetical protein
MPGPIGILEFLKPIFYGHAGQQLDVDEGAQALVLAEVAARIFIAMRDVADEFCTASRPMKEVLRPIL